MLSAFCVFLGPKLARLAHSATLILLYACHYRACSRTARLIRRRTPSFRPARPAFHADETAYCIVFRPFLVHGARFRGRCAAAPPAPAGGGSKGLAADRDRPLGARGGPERYARNSCTPTSRSRSRSIRWPGTMAARAAAPVGMTAIKLADGKRVELKPRGRSPLSDRARDRPLGARGPRAARRATRQPASSASTSPPLFRAARATASSAP